MFGEGSLLLNSPNKFNYMFNQIGDENLVVLSIDSLEFLKLISQDSYMLAMMKERA